MREIRLSGSVEGVVSNHDPYSDCRTHLHLRQMNRFHLLSWMEQSLR